ncbi:acyl-CoA dehydrogenase family protein [Saccharopolyspora sp. NPDC050642]|uniref:acyl-CoA dehydrogenase family protein n=1 Tax=Saccharopolyspora sp. NPDC050642 TaxID=3157099 RepID=UPI0033E0022D
MTTTGCQTTDWLHSDEQEELQRTVRRFLQNTCPTTEVRRIMETDLGHDPAVWARMADELGLQGLMIPEEYGGVGLGAVELALVMEEMGRALLPAPFLASSVLAAGALLASDDEAAKRNLLPGIASGRSIATVAPVDDRGGWGPDGARIQARRRGSGFALDGVVTFVLDGHVADLVLVPARTDNGVSLFAVTADGPGVTRTRSTTLDRTRPQARIELAGTPASLIGVEGTATSWLARAVDRAAVALAAEQIGGARHCLEASIGYAKERVQFGRPIGSFQAVKHALADLFIEIELASAAVQHAAWAAEHASGELPAAAALAKAYASDAYWHTAVANVHVHGGIGFTWEHDAHLYFKRAKSSQVQLGEPAVLRERLAREIGLAAFAGTAR